MCLSVWLCTCVCVWDRCVAGHLCLKRSRSGSWVEAFEVLCSRLVTLKRRLTTLRPSFSLSFSSSCNLSFFSSVLLSVRPSFCHPSVRSVLSPSFCLSVYLSFPSVLFVLPSVNPFRPSVRSSLLSFSLFLSFLPSYFPVLLSVGGGEI